MLNDDNEVCHLQHTIECKLNQTTSQDILTKCEYFGIRASGPDCSCSTYNWVQGYGSNCPTPAS